MQFDPLVGRKLGGYRIEGMLGEGGMARVYRGYHERLQRQVAVKVILPQSSGQAAFQRIFEQEAQLIARLQHRNIVAVYDFGEDSDTHMLYLVMQYVTGGTLSEQIVGRRPLETRRAALYALQMARALHHAHQKGIVHRDVKPLNMLVSGENSMELLLSDFGLAELFINSSAGPARSMQEPSSEEDQKLSRMGNVTGTPRYMSPEQCLAQAVDARTDIYALGIVLFEMLTGQPPFRASSLNGLLYQQVSAPPPPLQEINPAVPPALAQLTIKAMAKAREERFQTAKEMGQALESWLTPTPYVVTSGASGVTMPPGSPVVPLPPQRRKAIPLSRIITVCGSLITVAILLWQMGLLHLPGAVTSPPGQVSGGHSAMCTSTIGAQQTGAFRENFQDNSRGWPQESSDLIAPAVAPHAYTIHTGNTDRVFFMCPDGTKVGNLPAQFTLTASIAPAQGPVDAYYGLAFYLNPAGGSGSSGTAAKYTGYAFGINDQGTCALFKYHPDTPRGYDVLYLVRQFKGIHSAAAANILQVSVRNNTFSFSVNATTVPFHAAGQQSIGDSAYSSGAMGLFISGANATYRITQVELSFS